jgi:hypothetical protein
MPWQIQKAMNIDGKTNEMSKKEKDLQEFNDMIDNCDWSRFGVPVTNTVWDDAPSMDWSSNGIPKLMKQGLYMKKLYKPSEQYEYAGGEMKMENGVNVLYNMNPIEGDTMNAKYGYNSLMNKYDLSNMVKARNQNASQATYPATATPVSNYDMKLTRINVDNLQIVKVDKVMNSSKMAANRNFTDGIEGDNKKQQSTPYKAAKNQHMQGSIHDSNHKQYFNNGVAAALFSANDTWRMTFSNGKPTAVWRRNNKAKNLRSMGERQHAGFDNVNTMKTAFRR